jgi:hypothetical protein
MALQPKCYCDLIVYFAESMLQLFQLQGKDDSGQRNVQTPIPLDMPRSALVTFSQRLQRVK